MREPYFDRYIVFTHYTASSGKKEQRSNWDLLRCPIFAYEIKSVTLLLFMSACHFIQRQRNATIWALVQPVLGLKVVLPVPTVTPFSTAQSTAL